MHKLWSLSLSVLVLGGLPASANVKLPGLFSDHMVLQQDGKIPVWGWADPGEKVTVTVGADHVEATAAADGSWRVNLDPLPTTSTPVTMTVAGNNSIIIKDVVVGEVWLASGQSNMAFATGWETGLPDWLKKNGEGQILDPTYTNPQLRYFHTPGRPKIRPSTELDGHWEVVAAPKQLNLSAVGYFFIEQLQQKLNRPVGLVESDAGGTPIEAWSSAEALAQVPSKAEHLAQVKQSADAFPTDPVAQKTLVDAYQKNLADWDKNLNQPYQAAMKTWHDAIAAAKVANPKGPFPPVPTIQPPPPRPRNPGGEGGDYTTLFNGMINPLIPYAIRGAIWYQGEANSGAKPEYDLMFRAMVTDWRKRWGTDFTFLAVTLANIGERYPTPTDNGWAEVRGAEVKVTNELPNAGVAEAIDVGTAHNIHPYDKIHVGRRLAAQALRIAYGQKIVSSGPSFNSMTVEGNKIRIKWKDIGSGLALAVSPFVSDPAEKVNDNPALPIDKPLDFDIAGADQKWVRAEAKLDGNDVVIWSDQVPAPVAARYAWAQNPQVNLYNKEGFPAVPFRTQDWPAPTK